jgi:mRNA interferase MazF
MRGDVYWVDFEPSRGGEVQKQRPAVILSNDRANRILNRVQVVPLTSKTDRVYPAQVLVGVAGTSHKAMADQITTVAKSRLMNRVGALAVSDLRAVETAIKVQLGLS